jgi:hypothetical protein
VFFCVIIISRERKSVKRKKKKPIFRLFLKYLYILFAEKRDADGKAYCARYRSDDNGFFVISRAFGSRKQACAIHKRSRGVGRCFG